MSVTVNLPNKDNNYAEPRADRLSGSGRGKGQFREGWGGWRRRGKEGKEKEKGMKTDVTWSIGKDEGRGL